jgi:hypothetical protein
MRINRRNLLWATAGLAMTKLVGPASSQASLAGSDEFLWHPFTRSLLYRARQASLVDGRANTVLIERLIHQEVRIQACKPPVIKWLADPFDAFAYLSRLGLDELLRVDTTCLWRRAEPAVDMDEDRLNSAAVLGGVIGDIMRVSEHDNALMAPKQLSRARVMAENASADTVFKARAVAAQIGWLETCIPVVAPLAVVDIELLVSSGFADLDETLHHQLRAFEVYELGLPATWETPEAIVCVAKHDPPASTA